VLRLANENLFAEYDRLGGTPDRPLRRIRAEPQFRPASLTLPLTSEFGPKLPSLKVRYFVAMGGKADVTQHQVTLRGIKLAETWASKLHFSEYWTLRRAAGRVPFKSLCIAK
jgi:hypothetical protein